MVWTQDKKIIFHEILKLYSSLKCSTYSKYGTHIYIRFINIFAHIYSAYSKYSILMEKQLILWCIWFNSILFGSVAPKVRTHATFLLQGWTVVFYTDFLEITGLLLCSSSLQVTSQGLMQNNILHILIKSCHDLKPWVQ